MMEKSFEAAVVEKRIAARWEEEGAFRGGRAERAAAEPFCVVIPPPNVTGNLHMAMRSTTRCRTSCAATTA